MQPLVAPINTDKKRISSVESHQGRRFQKRVEEYQSGAWNETELTRFLYDDWNLIAEYDVNSGSNDLDKTYTWGLDLSLTPQGAGGVGGLLSMTDEANSQTYFYAFDANGNVTQLIDQSGNISAHYEYSPFGQLTTANGPMADENPYRFSTKYQDETTGLLYYGFRYYDPETGRWLNRDPIGERGGLNVYGFVGNNSISVFDLLGNCAVKNVKIDGEWEHVSSQVNIKRGPIFSMGSACVFLKSKNVKLKYKASAKGDCCKDGKKEVVTGKMEITVKTRLKELEDLICVGIGAKKKIAKLLLGGAKKLFKKAKKGVNEGIGKALVKAIDNNKPESSELGDWVDGCPCKNNE